MFERYTDKARRVLVLAQEAARSLGAERIGPEHLLLGVLQNEDTNTATYLEACGVNDEAVLMALQSNELSPTRGTLPFSDDAKAILDLTLREAVDSGSSYIGTEHVLLALLRSPDSLAGKILAAHNVELEAAREHLFAEPQAAGGARARSRRPGDRKKVDLADFGKDLTAAARAGKIDPVIGRDAEIRRVIQTLSRKTKNNPVLIGEPGVGKTAVVEGLAARIAAGDVPTTLRNATVFSLDMASLVAGTRYRGDFEERVNRLLSELADQSDILLFIDELHMVVGAGQAEGGLDAANMLKPLLARGEMQTIGATTLDEYRKHIEKDAALERRFQPLTINEPSPDDAYGILQGVREAYERHHQITIPDATLRQAVDLSHRYVADRYLPDKALDLLDEAAARLRLDTTEPPQQVVELERDIAALLGQKQALIAEQRFEDAARLRDQEKELRGQLHHEETLASSEAAAGAAELQPAHLAAVLSESTGLPIASLTTEESERLLHAEDEIHKRVIGQDKAVAALSRSLRRSRAGLQDPNRPHGSFVFAGPSGVGKTELAKAVAEFLFGDQNALISLDMSEYGERHTVARLFGAPPGYVGYEEGGQLTEKVRRKPFSVILLDEVEKAHPDVFNALLQVLDEGRLTDATGRSVNFRNTVIIMTTNLGTRSTASLGFAPDDDDSAYERLCQTVTSDLKAHFRPEFLNRIDDTIVFHALSPADIGCIVDLTLEDMGDRLVAAGVTLLVSADAKAALASEGYDADLGARPLRRVVQRRVEDPASEMLLTGQLTPGATLDVDYRDSEFTLSVIDAPTTSTSTS